MMPAVKVEMHRPCTSIISILNDFLYITEQRNGGIPSLNKYELLEQFPSDIHCKRENGSDLIQNKIRFQTNTQAMSFL